jgi:hypothetical protein
MTETEWLSCDDPSALLKYVGQRTLFQNAHGRPGGHGRKSGLGAKNTSIRFRLLPAHLALARRSPDTCGNRRL